MALTRRAAWTEQPGRRLVSIPIVAGTRIYDGALVAVAAGGALENWSGDTATTGNTSFFMGVARITEQTGVAIAAGESKVGTTALDVEAAVDVSGVILKGITITGASAANVGNFVYASDENTFTFTATPGDAAIGWCRRFVSATDSDLVLFTPAEYMTQTTVVRQLGYVHIRDEKTDGTAGGTFTNSAWRTRDLNTIASDRDGLAALASNQITLQPGRYVVHARCPGSDVGEHSARLQNITDTTTDLVGGNADLASELSSSDATVRGVISISAAKVYELQHQCQTTLATTGFGSTVAWTDHVEVYSEIEFTRLGDV